MEIRDLFSLITHNLILIITVILLFMIGGAFVSTLLIVPEYEASATLIVNKSSSQTNSSTDYSYNDILLTQKLVDTYSVIITSDSVLNQVISNLDLNLSVNELRSQTSIAGVNDTEIIKIVVKDSIPERAVNIANEITRVAPTEIVRTAKAGSVELIDYAVVPDKPVSPNITNNIIISGFAGLVFVMLLLIVRKYLDRTIKNSVDIENLFNLPVIGQIPKF